MNTQNNTSVLDKIRKLWATAADAAATPAEAATAMRLASRLLDQARLDEAAVRAHFARQSDPAVRARDAAGEMATRTWGPNSGRHDAWLGMAVGAIVGCGVYQSQFAGRKVIVAYGLPADLAVGEALYAYVTTHLRTQRLAFRAVEGIRGGSVPDRSFADGYSLELLRRARAEHEERAKSTETMESDVAGNTGSTPMMALVVVEGDAVREHDQALTIKAKSIGLAKGRARARNTDSYARSRGAAAAGSVSLSRGLVS